MKIQKLDIVVPIIGGLTCFLLLLNIPVWALFFGWAWYFNLGAAPNVFKKAIPPMFFGYVVAGISIIVFNALSGNIYVLAAIVCLTIFLLMLSMKASVFAASLASFNAYSCLFAGYFAGNYPALANGGPWDLYNVVISILWIALANVLGLICGYLSIRLGVQKNQAKEI